MAETTTTPPFMRGDLVRTHQGRIGIVVCAASLDGMWTVRMGDGDREVFATVAIEHVQYRPCCTVVANFADLLLRAD